MKINGTLNTFAANLTKNLNIANKSNGANSAKEAQNATSTHQSSQEYLRNLRQKYPNINIAVVDFKSEKQELNYMLGCSGGNNIAIPPNIIEKMANDPATAAKYEKVIEDIPNAYETIKKGVESQPGSKLIACGAMVDKDGNVTYWSVSSKTGEGPGTKEKLQEQLEKIREKHKTEKKSEAKRKEKTEIEKALEEKQTEKSKEVSERLNHIFSKGKNVTEVISNIITGKAIRVSIGSSEIASIDVKV